MKYKVGDRVRIKTHIIQYPEANQAMAIYEGGLMTIRSVSSAGYVMREDATKWVWDECLIEGLAEPEPKKPTMTEVYQMAIDTYGEDEQCRMIQEEMDELGVALSKWHRKPSEDTLAQVQEEIADVCIMMQQAKLMFGEKDIDTIIIEKADRLYDRLKDNQTVEVVSGKHKINGNTYTWINPDKVKV